MDSLKQTEKIVKISKVLSDSNRMEIIKLLNKRSMCVHAIVCHLNISQPAVSKHLKQLADIGLLVSEKKGMYVHYSLKKEILLNYLNDIEKIVS